MKPKPTSRTKPEPGTKPESRTSPRTKRKHCGRAAVLAVTAGLALTSLTACGAVSTALDCANTAAAVARSASDLQQAVSRAGDSPQDAQNALDQIETNLKQIGDRTGNADLTRAIGSLDTAVQNVRTALRNGDPAPDITPVADAAGELAKVCTPG